jgi:hypothetical protein
MDLARVTDAYFVELGKQGEAVVEDYNRDDLWTRRATTALSQVGLSLFPEHQLFTKAPIAGAMRPVRGQHHAVDVLLAPKDGWGDPSFLAEHESSPRKARVQADAWRLFSIHAKVRVLIAYWGTNTEFATFADLRKAMYDVARDHFGKELLVIGGESGHQPRTLAALRAAHDFVAIGQDTES